MLPLSPAHPEAAPSPTQSQHHLGKGEEGPGGLLGQGPLLLLPSSSPLHFNTLPPAPACLQSSECSEHYQCLHFCHCLCWLHFKGNKVELCLPTRKPGVGFFFSPQHAKARPKTRHQAPLEGLGQLGVIFLGGMCILPPPQPQQPLSKVNSSLAKPFPPCPGAQGAGPGAAGDTGEDPQAAGR